MKLNGFHATWGPNAHLLTREQRAAALNRVLEQVATGVGEPLDFADSQREVI